MTSQLIAVFISGAIVGVMVNYLADVLPRTRRLVKPVCLGCGEQRRLWDFLIGRKCDRCGKRNATRYWLVVILEIVLAALVLYFPTGDLPFWASEIVLIVFSIMVITDLEFRVILEQVSISGYVVAFFAGWALHGWLKTILGGISGFLIFLALYYFGRLFARKLNRGRDEPMDEEALGFGDVHLAGIIGLITGFPYNLTALLLAILLGGITSAVFILVSVARKQYQAFQAIPYGPFIILGGIMAIYYFL